ncbi:MAG: KilA-N domain-containing protein [Pirellulales bacterium]
MNALRGSQSLTYQGTVIHFNRRRMVNLTDMWRAVGKPKNRDPGQWMRLPTTSVLVRFLESNMGFSHVWKSTPGNSGGTWAIPNLAVAYAEYLSPRFHAWATETILASLEAAGARNGQVERWLRRGKDPGWVRRRLEGMLARNSFTDTLKDHGVAEFGYAECTNAVYRKLLGNTAKEQKLSRGLPAKANLRDHLTSHELAALGFSESLAERKIDSGNLQGNYLCKVACEVAGNAVRQVIEQVDIRPHSRIGHAQHHANDRHAG